MSDTATSQAFDPHRMQRRRYLQVATAALVPTAGCSGLVPDATPDPTTTPTRSTSEAPTQTTRTTDSTPPESDALVVTEQYPVEGTMVNLGVSGTATNTGDVTLVDCQIVASGVVGDERFRGTAERDRLEPGSTWDWEVAFGESADAKSEDSVTDIEVETRAREA